MACWLPDGVGEQQRVHMKLTPKPLYTAKTVLHEDLMGTEVEVMIGWMSDASVNSCANWNLATLSSLCHNAQRTHEESCPSMKMLSHPQIHTL